MDYKQYLYMHIYSRCTISAPLHEFIYVFADYLVGNKQEIPPKGFMVKFRFGRYCLNSNFHHTNVFTILRKNSIRL
jgi:hypothetical protein